MTHYPVGPFNDMMWINHDVSYLSHFRESLKDIHEKNITITDLKFDYNYFICFFIPLVKELKDRLRLELDY